jgi:hypothetical protein
MLKMVNGWQNVWDMNTDPSTSCNSNEVKIVNGKIVKW